MLAWLLVGFYLSNSVSATCVAYTTSTITPPPGLATTSTTYIPSGTAAVVTYSRATPLIVVAESCATASVSGGATADAADGGALYLSGLQGTYASGGVAPDSLGDAITSATLEYCNYCTFQMTQGVPTLSIGTAFSGTITQAPPAAATPITVTANYIQGLTASLTNAADVTITKFNGGVVSISNGGQNQFGYTGSSLVAASLYLVNPSFVTVSLVSGHGLVNVVCTAMSTSCSVVLPQVTAAYVNFNGGGSLSVSGIGYSASISTVQSATFYGTYQQVYVEAGATGTISGSGCAGYFSGADGSIGGPSCTVTLEQAGTVTVGSGVNFLYQYGGLATLQSGVAGAISIISGTAAVGVTFTVYSNQGQAPTITVSPGTSISTASTITSRSNFGASVLAAVLTGTNMRRRDKLPLQTAGACGIGLTYCPSSDIGGYSCVDTRSDIFNCGGCGETGAGVDCTTISDENVECVKGECVVTSELTWQ